ncbi:MAG: hypothetical protein J7J76_04145 [Candidatus Latescibacteria bacterium]|nr:hypothetical protein [Candidatus Latescibacterota bacterium]
MSRCNCIPQARDDASGIPCLPLLLGPILCQEGQGKLSDDALAACGPTPIIRIAVCDTASVVPDDHPRQRPGHSHRGRQGELPTAGGESSLLHQNRGLSRHYLYHPHLKNLRQQEDSGGLEGKAKVRSYLLRRIS